MSSIKLSPNASGTGEFTIAAPNSNTNRTLTLPDQTGTVLTGSGPISVNASTPINAVTLDASGNLGVGTTSPGGKFEVRAGRSWFQANSEPYALYLTYASGTNGYFVGGTSDSALAFSSANGSERARIDSSGNFLVGTTSAVGSSRLFVRSAGTGVNFHTMFRNGAGTDLLYVREDGVINTGTASLSPYNLTTAAGANMHVSADGTVYRSTSSLKYKTDVQDATYGLAEVMALRPVTYKGKNDGDKVFGGLIAEEVHEAGLTEFVQYAEDGTPDALAYANMVSLAFKAIQEQQAIIDAQQTALQTLTARIEALEAK